MARDARAGGEREIGSVLGSPHAGTFKVNGATPLSRRSVEEENE
jgi:hypothetical protein